VAGLLDAASPGYARAPRRTSVILRADIIALAHESVATNTEHGGIVLVPSFREDEFQAIADAIVDVLRPYREGLEGIVVHIKR
jgi:hypothetical protein